MAPSSVHLPNGQNLTVTPIFGGLSFKPVDQNINRSAFPPGWTITLNEEEHEPTPPSDQAGNTWDFDSPFTSRRALIHRYKRPTLQNDHLFISSISSPSAHDFKPPSSPTRQLAMMLWASLWWYFHQPEPDPRILNDACKKTAVDGRPRGEWRININREGLFKGKNVLAKLERMGLITTEDSSTAGPIDDENNMGWNQMFVSRRAFWQLDPRIFLFTLEPVLMNSPMPGNSPFPSRPGSPTRAGSPATEHFEPSAKAATTHHLTHSFGPFQSNSHLPTYYPPHPPQYVYTNNIRHPIRAKPYRQGETFYCRYVPSVGQYLSFRLASLAPYGVSRHGPWSSSKTASHSSGHPTPRHSLSDPVVPTLAHAEHEVESDVALLHRWMNDERVSHFWGEQGPVSHQEQFLKQGLSSRHSFPVIGCWDGKPFGYFEIYWVKEDVLGKHLGGEVGDFDRGIHFLVGEKEFRGPHRVRIWLSALTHYCWLADMRTSCVMIEPRVDNTKVAQYCYDVGFFKEREISFPHKQSNLMKIRRDAWEKPVI